MTWMDEGGVYHVEGEQQVAGELFHNFCVSVSITVLQQV